MQPLREKRENIKNLLKKLYDTPSSALQKLPSYKKKRALQLIFILTVVFAMFFSEFVLAIASPNKTLQAYAYFLDNNVGGNGVANALGKLTITEKAHLLIKGSGHYVIKIVDSQDTVLFSKVGDFNKTGYAEVVFTLSPSKFRVGESYYAYITAEDNPFPLLYRRAEVKIPFKIHKDYPVIGLGAVRDGNQTLITARILTGAGPLKNKKIWFAYKIYNANETLRTLGYALSDNDGRAVFVTNALNDSRMYLIVAEFYGDDMYMPAAASQAYLPVITAKDYSIHDALLNALNNTKENSYVLQNQNKGKDSVKYDKTGRAVLSSMSYKTAMTVGERFKKVTASDRIKSNTNSDYKFKFTEEDLASLSLVEFLKRITTDDTPASALINIANILMNLDNVPFVLEQTQELLSKLQVPLIPDVAHSSLTEIRLYRTKSYVVNVEKTVAEKHVETYTVTKKVSKKVKYTEKITKKIKVRVQYIYYQKIVRKEMAFVRKPRPHWQIVYVVIYKPIIKWKYVWKTVTYTVTKYKTVWSTVTETKTRVYYTYKTITEKVKKEKREYFRILITKGFTVINEQTNEKMTLQQFFLFVMGFREDALGQIINYLEAKVFGPALDILQQFIDFLINVSKKFLLTLVKKLFEEIKSLVFQGLMLHMVRYSNNSDNRNDSSEEGNMGKSGSKSGEYRDYLYMSSGKKYKLERANRPYNLWDSLYKLYAPRKPDIAESTKLTIELSVLEAKAEYFITGEETAVVIPLTSEALVYNMQQEQNNEPEIGWLDLNHYDHTIAKYGEFDVYDWHEKEPTVSKKEMGYIPLGVTRTTYLILLPDTTSADGRKVVVGYSIDVVDDNTKLVPDTLKEFPELAEVQKVKTEKAKRIGKSFYTELKDMEEHILKAENIETYGDLRNAIATKYEPNMQELIKAAVENSKVSGINVGEGESGGVRSQFFVINKDFTWTDSEGNEHTPIEINYSYFITETGSESKYTEASRVLLGIVGKKDRKSMGPVEDQFADIHKGKAVAEKIFEGVCEIAKTNDIPANGVLRVISPSLLDKVGDIRIVGESDEFQNNACAITIVDPTLANPIAALYLDYFRAFAEHEYKKTRDSLGSPTHFKTAQIVLFRKSIIDAYRIAILFHKDPEEIKFKFKYKEGERIESAEVSLAFLMQHESEFNVVSGGNIRNVRSIKINGKDVPVDKVVEGFMRLTVKQDNVNHKVILQPLDENLKPIENKQIVFDFQEKVYKDKKGNRKYVRRLVLSDDKDLAKMQKDFLGDWSVESMLLVHGTLYACFKDMFHDSPELESRFIKLLGDAEHLGQNPAKSAVYLIFFLLQDTKGGDTTFVSAKRYMITLLRHERRLAKLKSDLDNLLNDPERLSRLTPEELKGLKETYEKIDTELKKLRERIIVFLEDHFNSMKNAEKHKNKIVICMEVTKRYLEKLLGGKEGIKSISKNIAIGTLVGLIFPRVVAETIMTLDMSILEEILARDAKAFAALMSNKELQLGIGLSLSAVTFALLNLDIHRFMKAGTAGATRTAGTAGTSSHANHNTHKSSIIGEFFGQLFDIKMILATFLSGFGMILKALADAPFYTTEEIAEEISKQVHEKLGETAGVIWDMTAGYRIPGLDMTGFEVALTVLLQGNGGVIQLITTAVTKAVEYMIVEVIKPLVEPVIAEYTYYMVDALAA